MCGVAQCNCPLGYVEGHAAFGLLYLAVFGWLLYSKPPAPRLLYGIVGGGTVLSVAFHTLLGGLCASATLLAAVRDHFKTSPIFQIRVLYMLGGHVLMSALAAYFFRLKGGQAATRKASVLILTGLVCACVLGWWWWSAAVDTAVQAVQVPWVLGLLQPILLWVIYKSASESRAITFLVLRALPAHVLASVGLHWLHSMRWLPPSLEPHNFHEGSLAWSPMSLINNGSALLFWASVSHAIVALHPEDHAPPVIAGLHPGRWAGSGRLFVSALVVLMSAKQVSEYSKSHFELTVRPDSVDLTYSTALYDSIMLYVHGANKVMSEGGDLSDSEAVAAAVRNVSFTGVASTLVELDSNGDRIENYEVMNNLVGSDEADKVMTFQVATSGFQLQEYTGGSARFLLSSMEANVRWPTFLTWAPWLPCSVAAALVLLMVANHAKNCPPRMQRTQRGILPTNFGGSRPVLLSEGDLTESAAETGLVRRMPARADLATPPQMLGQDLPPPKRNRPSQATDNEPTSRKHPAAAITSRICSNSDYMVEWNPGRQSAIPPSGATPEVQSPGYGEFPATAPAPEQQGVLLMHQSLLSSIRLPDDVAELPRFQTPVPQDVEHDVVHEPNLKPSRGTVAKTVTQKSKHRPGNNAQEVCAFVRCVAQELIRDGALRGIKSTRDLPLKYWKHVPRARTCNQWDLLVSKQAALDFAQRYFDAAHLNSSRYQVEATGLCRTLKATMDHLFRLGPWTPHGVKVETHISQWRRKGRGKEAALEIMEFYRSCHTQRPQHSDHVGLTTELAMEPVSSCCNSPTNANLLEQSCHELSYPSALGSPSTIECSCNSDGDTTDPPDLFSGGSSASPPLLSWGSPLLMEANAAAEIMDRFLEASGGESLPWLPPSSEAYGGGSPPSIEAWGSPPSIEAFGGRFDGRFDGGFDGELPSSIEAYAAHEFVDWSGEEQSPETGDSACAVGLR